ncbi:MAG: ParB/RepB/Spo0J family partition protein [Clostridia bacterium]|nr:ParB/RepB/Spo0J family partition protein [Clostridia bacterium]
MSVGKSSINRAAKASSDKKSDSKYLFTENEPPKPSPEKEAAAGDGLAYVPLSAIDHSYSKQPEFKKDGHKKLTESVKKYGILVPLILRPSKNKPGTYKIVSGNRRFFAAKDAGLDSVPALIIDCDDRKAAEIFKELEKESPKSSVYAAKARETSDTHAPSGSAASSSGRSSGKPVISKTDAPAPKVRIPSGTSFSAPADGRWTVYEELPTFLL